MHSPHNGESSIQRRAALEPSEKQEFIKLMRRTLARLRHVPQTERASALVQEMMAAKFLSDK